MPKRIPRGFNRHPNLFAFALMIVVFLWATFSFQSVVKRLDREAHKRKTAFCSLVYLFDQSIRLQGNTDLGPMQKPYDDWRRDVRAADCPKKPNIVIPTTTTTALR